MHNDTHNTKESTLKHEVLACIERDNVKPIPGVVHTVRNNAFWMLWGATVLLGSGAVAIVIFTELNAGWEFYDETHDNALTFMFATLPLIWVVLLAAMAALGLYNIRKTKRGYKYSLPLVIIASIVASMFGGHMLHLYGFSDELSEHVGHYMPFHKPIAVMRIEQFSQPSRGLYAGEVIMLDGTESQLFMKSFGGEEYMFDTSFVPIEVMERAVPNERVVVFSVHRDEDGNKLIACHILKFDQPPHRSLADLRENRDRILAESRREISPLALRNNPCMERTQKQRVP